MTYRTNTTQTVRNLEPGECVEYDGLVGILIAIDPIEYDRLGSTRFVGYALTIETTEFGDVREIDLHADDLITIP